MITRIVKMSFKPEYVASFLTLFNSYATQIGSAEGCISLQLVKSTQVDVFFTISVWQDERFLEQYRNSELFNTVWSITKTYFNDKPEAWSTQLVYAQ